MSFQAGQENGPENGGTPVNRDTQIGRTFGLSENQVQELVKGHMGGYETIKTYRDRKIEDIYEFALDKAIYVVQFIRDDKMIEYGSNAQKEACKFCGIGGELARSIWEDGGLEAFRKGVSVKRKTIVSAVRECIKKSKFCVR